MFDVFSVLYVFFITVCSWFCRPADDLEEGEVNTIDKHAASEDEDAV
jgi:hypothetical protein